MVPKTSYPPAHHHPHLTQSLSPSQAQTKLTAYLDKTEAKPYLHPDALLSTSGITYSAQSGPTGGLAIHHLKRIAAGLRGENLIAETADDLAQFGEEEVLPEGDDARVDQLIDGNVTTMPRKGGLKRKRSTEEVAQWADESSEAAFGEHTRAAAEHNEGWQDQEDYELAQQPMRGDVGDRVGATVVSQNGAPPTIAHVNDDDADDTPNKPLTQADKAARRAAKKAKRAAEKAELIEKKTERNTNG